MLCSHVPYARFTTKVERVGVETVPSMLSRSQARNRDAAAAGARALPGLGSNNYTHWMPAHASGAGATK